jgi:hypothetical protein
MWSAHRVLCGQTLEVPVADLQEPLWAASRALQPQKLCGQPLWSLLASLQRPLWSASRVLCGQLQESSVVSTYSFLWPASRGPMWPTSRRLCGQPPGFYDQPPCFLLASIQSPPRPASRILYDLPPVAYTDSL